MSELNEVTAVEETLVSDDDFFDAFKADEKEEPEPEPEPENQEVAKAEKPTEEAEPDASESEDEPAPEPDLPVDEPVKDEPKMVPLAVAQEERGKRQALEARLQSLEQQQSQTTDEPVDWYADPDKGADQLRNEFKSEIDNVRQEQVARHMNLSEQYAVKEYGKDQFEAAKNAYLESVSGDMQALQQLTQMDDPAGHAYNEGVRILELAKYGGDQKKRDDDIAARAVQAYIDKQKETAGNTAKPPKTLSKKASESVSDEIEPDLDESDFSSLYN